jgi:hypothetical protein
MISKINSIFVSLIRLALGIQVEFKLTIKSQKSLKHFLTKSLK